MKENVNIQEATHVKVGGVYEKIVDKWGVDSKTGHLAKPSEGGFGVITESGKRVDMWTAERYGKES